MGITTGPQHTTRPAQPKLVRAAEHRSTVSGAGSIVLGIGIALSALLGPLGFGLVRFRASASANAQVAGGELASLVLAAPAAIAGGMLWMRDRRVGPMLVIGPASYAVYTYLQYIVGPEYDRYPGNNERAFPAYAALMLIAWLLAVRAWQSLSDLSAARFSSPLRRWAAALMLALSTGFALLWISGISAVLRGTPPAGYHDDPVLFWLIRLIDLAFFIPATVITAIELARGRPWAARSAFTLMSVQTLIVAAVAGMATRMLLRDDAAASVALATATSVTAILLLATVVQIGRAATSAWSGEPVPSSGSGDSLTY